MATAENILAVYSNRGRRQLPLEGVYRQLYRPDLYLRAYGKLYRNSGAIPPGSNNETVDAMSLEKIDRIIDVMRREAWRWTPTRRTYIPKKKGKRPLGLPAWSDKLVQEALRLLLEAYYEPRFSALSFGFRPGRGCYSALRKITYKWRGVKWFIEGDIKGCFDNIDHDVLLLILRESIHDNRLIRLVSSMLRAGYSEDWRYNKTLSGTPQGGVCSPLLSNICLDKLDRFVEDVLLPKYNQGERRRNYPPYKALLNASSHAGDKGEYQRAKMLRLQAQHMPSRAPEDPDFRRLWYVRYADDFLLGFSGPRHEAEEIKWAIRQFLHETLKLEMSTEKTLITHIRTEAARFLGYEVVTLDAMTKQDHRGQSCINSAVRLKIPVEVIRQQCQKYMRNGKPPHRPERLYNDNYSIVAQYQAEYRGFVQYYLMGFNAHRLWNVHRVMRKSLLGTLANKHRTTVSRIVRSLRTEVTVGDKTIKALQIVRHKGQGKRPLVATFGGLSLAWQKDTVISDNPKQVFNGVRSELISRLLAQTCECCETNDGPFEVYHIRKLSDLSQWGRKEKPRWLRIMDSRHRKTLVVCRECHQNIHRTRPARHREI
ncbi:reverse transcriptase/maturase family protein [Salmonella enterica]|uniref:Maturase n=1 Tax=Salmonella enterica subsp. enterica serovar Macclesfield str. S-1643 TaxID=1242107 RepID=A0A241PXG2_SALET|nr:reverse transcriptase/maturase family protein [Salmonella enterica]ASG19080.1 maturase [Salmonella enterica subsp. enterica serovar Macclesfield str. S-1643]EAA5488546.1 maturase [Salmonella enterica subsp. enterica serovar Kouka]